MTNMLRWLMVVVVLTMVGCSDQDSAVSGDADTDAAEPTVTEPAGDEVAAREDVSPESVGDDTSADSVMVEVVNGEWRNADDTARDSERHPVESLTFWGLRPGMTILELQPGAGWWTEILASYALRTGGRLDAATSDLNDPEVPERVREQRQRYAVHLDASPEIYGTVALLNWGARSGPLPAESFDFALVARSIHGWMRRGMTESAFTRLYDALKPGGVLAIEQHRADPGEQDPKAESGYVTESFVIEKAREAGFELAGRSEVNANPKDTKDHLFGVWTLPPTRLTAPFGETPDPDFDRTEYDAIGESDRMTLRFVKPAAL